MPNYWVSTTTRELVVQDTDFSYKGLGPKISITRTYNMPRNGAISVFGMFGDRWTFPYESSVDHRGQSEQPMYRYVRLKKGSGQRLTYYIDLSKAPPLEASLPVGVYDRLTWYGGYWLLKEKDTHLTYRYDQTAGKSYSSLTSIADPDGNEVGIDYDANETIQAIVDAAGRPTTFQYDANKRCTSMTTPDGRTAAYHYDSGGHLIRSVDLNGAETVYTYDAQHYMISMTAAGKTTLFDRAGGDKIQKVTDARGNATQYAPRTNGGILVTDPEGRIRFYDSTQQGFTTFNGYLDEDLKPLSLTFTSYSNGRPSEFMDARGNTLKMEYDARGNLTEVTDPLGNKTAYAYDANDNLISRTNPLNETRQYEYDDRHHLIRATSPMGNKTTMTYNELGQMTGIADANQNTNFFGYDDFGNLEMVTDPLGHTKRITYDPEGLVRASIIDEINNETRYDYDNNDRLVSVTHPDGTSRTYGYDCCADVSMKDENGHTMTLTRDPGLNVTEMTDPLGNKTKKKYDKNGSLTSVSNPLGNTATKSYDAQNRLVSSTDTKEETIEMGYDPNGNLISLWDQREKKYQFTYDDNNLLISTTDPLGKGVNVKRDALGRVDTVTNARGGKIGFTYDADGRVTKKTYDGVTQATYAYNAVGSLTTVTDSTGSTTYTYDSRNRVTGIGYPSGKTLSLTYDTAGNIGSMSYCQGALAVNYTYDSRNRVSTVEWNGNSIAFSYDGVGNVTHEARSNGTDSTFGYDANGRIIQINHKKGSDSFAQMTYARDKAGNTTGETRTLPLLSSLSARSIYSTVNDANQITKWGSDCYTYDPDGNLASATGTRAFSATYDHENRLTSISRNGITTTYSYDGRGNRTKAVTGSTVSNYHYDHLDRLLFESNGSGQVVAYYIHGGEWIGAMGYATHNYFYHFDKTGNTVALSDEAGNVNSAYVYEPFGKISSQSGSIPNPFTYVGAYGVMDEGDGLFFMKSRHYDAEGGKFLQKDPIGIVGGVNLYAYVRNNPVDRVDPAGLLETVADMLIRRMNGAGTEEIMEWDRTNRAMEKGTYIPNYKPKAKYIVDKVISYLPVYGNIWGAAKALNALREQNYVEALKEGLGALPVYGLVIQIGTDLGEGILIWGKMKVPNTDKCGEKK